MLIDDFLDKHPTYKANELLLRDSILFKIETVPDTYEDFLVWETQVTRLLSQTEKFAELSERMRKETSQTPYQMDRNECGWLAFPIARPTYKNISMIFKPQIH